MTGVGGKDGASGRYNHALPSAAVVRILVP
jgi:hypothetical protein